MYEKTVLSNGVRIVYEKMPNVRSAAVGIWVGVGSRHESAKETGSAHFIEHMLFKGTADHSAKELADIMDGIGGQINAFTTRESTCFYARVLDSHLDTAIDLLCDMFFNSKFLEEDVVSERGVILEEIDMYDDSPEDIVSERLFSRVFKGSLGRPVLGRRKVLEEMTGESLRTFMRNNYRAPEVVVSLCGSFTESNLVRIKTYFARMGRSDKPSIKKGTYAPALFTRKKAIEQNHICIAFPGLNAGSSDRFAMQLMSGILGGGMSSRLFQTVRERRGLCYSIYSFATGFSDTGIFGVMTALGKETEMEAISLILDEIKAMADSGISEAELDRAREQMKSNIVISLESTSARMNKLGSGELVHGYSLGPDELIERYDAVTREDVLTVARNILDMSRISFSAVGRIAPADEYKEIFKLDLN